MDILSEAERKYTNKLCEAVIPVMVDTFWDIWLEAKLKAKGQKVLQNYQEMLRDVKHNWSNTRVKKHVDDIIKANALFPNLLAAVMVCHVKILSSIRLDKKNKKISLKLPGNDIFVHTCYINAAKDLYEDPYIISSEAPPAKRFEELNRRFNKCVRDAIDSLVPTEEILKTYIVMPDDTSLAIDEEEEAPEMSDDPLDPLGQDPVPDTPAEPEVDAELQPAGSVNTPAETPGGTKTVAVTPNLTPPTVHQENLFDDAKE